MIGIVKGSSWDELPGRSPWDCPQMRPPRSFDIPRNDGGNHVTDTLDSRDHTVAAWGSPTRVPRLRRVGDSRTVTSPLNARIRFIKARYAEAAAIIRAECRLSPEDDSARAIFCQLFREHFSSKPETYPPIIAPERMDALRCSDPLRAVAVSVKENLDALWLELLPFVRKVLVSIGDAEEIQNLLSDIYSEALLENVITFRDQGAPFQAMIAGTARNYKRQWFRKKARERDLITPLGDMSPDLQPSPESDADSRDRAVFLSQIVDLYSARFPRNAARDILVLRLFFSDKYRHAEIAEILETSEANVRVIMHRALKNMKLIMGEVDDEV